MNAGRPSHDVRLWWDAARRKTRRGRSCHKAYTMIELLAAIAVTSVTLTFVAFALHTMYRAGDQLKKELLERQTIQRIGQRLRQDAHQAAAVTTLKTNDAENRVLRLTYADGNTVEYSLSNAKLERTQKKGDQLKHRDEFALSAASGNFWIVDTERDSPLVSLHLFAETAERQPSTPRNVTVIQAAVGLSATSAMKQKE